MCKTEKLWQAGDRQTVNDFYSKRNSKQQNLPSSYEELMNGWHTRYKPRFYEILDDINNDNLLVFFNRIDISILRKEKGSQQMIWMNYKLLEAEIERLEALKYIAENIMPHKINILSTFSQRFTSDE